ncbi:hypothetical protein HELRODRAFT_171072 [Helobdella robusta]|uniref:Uncharacterized protein n=1 Tax=Helobdella robusta TaxID=6412 RepID=T1F3S3_HELRO|nr:hypothetical protein HELRODRAFT_171072 [Helobdella robusta]ESO07030.1 hypothetical protein HELRODRAFT_171072 [Helobdella robusta]
MAKTKTSSSSSLSLLASLSSSTSSSSLLAGSQVIALAPHQIVSFINAQELANSQQAFYQTRYATSSAAAAVAAVATGNSNDAWTAAGSPLGSTQLLQPTHHHPGTSLLMGHQLISSGSMPPDFLGQVPQAHIVAHVAPTALAATAYVQAQIPSMLHNGSSLQCYDISTHSPAVATNYNNNNSNNNSNMHHQQQQQHQQQNNSNNNPLASALPCSAFILASFGPLCQEGQFKDLYSCSRLRRQSKSNCSTGPTIVECTVDDDPHRFHPYKPTELMARKNLDEDLRGISVGHDLTKEQRNKT